MTARSVLELCHVVTSGGTPKRSVPEYFSPPTVPWVKTGDLSDGPVNSVGEYISERGLMESAAKLLPAGAVLMAMYGATVGAMGWLPRPMSCNQAACAMVANPRVCDWRWLYYALLTKRDDIAGLANGAAQQNLNVGIIAATQLDAPSLSTQRAIAEVLGALDDKIAANTSLIAMLDDLRRLRYSLLLDGANAPLSSLARFVNGRAYTKGATGSGRVVIRIAELNAGLGGSTVYNDIDVPDDNLARPGDLLFAWSGSLTAARWYRPEAIVNQHIFKVIPNQGWPMWLVACAVDRKLDDFKAIAADKATTMGHIQRHHLDEPVEVPDAGSIAANDVEMSTLWSRALAAEIESLRLAELRDTLLPHLMSGRITVREAEKQVEEAL